MLTNACRSRRGQGRWESPGWSPPRLSAPRSFGNSEDRGQFITAQYGRRLAQVRQKLAGIGHSPDRGTARGTGRSRWWRACAGSNRRVRVSVARKKTALIGQIELQPGAFSYRMRGLDSRARCGPRIAARRRRGRSKGRQNQELVMLDWLTKPADWLLGAGGWVASWFYDKDTENFLLVQMLFATLVLAGIVTLMICWQPIGEYLRSRLKPHRMKEPS